MAYPWIKGWHFSPEVAEMGEAVLPERGRVERGLKAEAPATRRRAQKNPPCILAKGKSGSCPRKIT
jgi:hypothetical protein